MQFFIASRICFLSRNLSGNFRSYLSYLTTGSVLWTKSEQKCITDLAQKYGPADLKAYCQSEDYHLTNTAHTDQFILNKGHGPWFYDYLCRPGAVKSSNSDADGSKQYRRLLDSAEHTLSIAPFGSVQKNFGVKAVKPAGMSESVLTKGVETPKGRASNLSDSDRDDSIIFIDDTPPKKDRQRANQTSKRATNLEKNDLNSVFSEMSSEDQYAGVIFEVKNSECEPSNGENVEKCTSSCKMSDAQFDRIPEKCSPQLQVTPGQTASSARLSETDEILLAEMSTRERCLSTPVTSTPCKSRAVRCNADFHSPIKELNLFESSNAINSDEKACVLDRSSFLNPAAVSLDSLLLTSALEISMSPVVKMTHSKAIANFSTPLQEDLILKKLKELDAEVKLVKVSDITPRPDFKNMSDKTYQVFLSDYKPCFELDFISCTSKPHDLLIFQFSYFNTSRTGCTLACNLEKALR